VLVEAYHMNCPGTSPFLLAWFLEELLCAKNGVWWLLTSEAIVVSNVLQAIRRMRNDERHQHQSPVFPFDDVPVGLEKRVEIIVVIVE